MDLEVVGRHALLFDDDAMASFVNSTAALVVWNSLSIDRYDVRHLLSGPPPPRKRRRHPSSPSQTADDTLESELDRERYLDLPPPSPSPSDQQDGFNDEEPVAAGGTYNAVAFSYGKSDESNEQKDTNAESSFWPPFAVPESLIQSLPPTEKVHQIIARTAMFVSRHGGQSEIVLRVKQGDNPTFGFLMPDHPLHPYFRFLVDHQELLSTNSVDEESKADSALDQAGSVRGAGALSLLGTIYGSGEDEEGAMEHATEVKGKESVETGVTVNKTSTNGPQEKASSLIVNGKDEKVTKHSAPLKEKASLIKRNLSITTVKAGTTTGVKKESVTSATAKSRASSLPTTSKVTLPVVEPSSDLKRVVDKIVEFILKNGRQFEAVLVEQDVKHGRFPFLLPSNLYHPYYLKVLQKAEKSKLPGNISEKHDSSGLRVEKKATPSRESDSVSVGSDIPYDSDRKEKFKMVICKSKKDGQDPPPKATQPQFGVSVDVAAAAAILQAATRGIKNPSLEILSKTSLNVSSQAPSGEGGNVPSFGSLLLSQPQSSVQKPGQTGEPSVSGPVANAIAKTAAIAAASEADSSEACLTKEEMLKAERLKRAKMFAAIIKSGAAPLKTESSRGLSAEPPESGVSGSGVGGGSPFRKEREGSSVALDVNTSDENEKLEKIHSAIDHTELRSKRKYRSRLKRHEEGSRQEDEEEEEEEEKQVDEHLGKRRQSHHSSRHSRDRRKHRKRRTSSKDRDSRHQQKQDSSSDDEQGHNSDYSGNDHHHSRHRRKQDSSSDTEHRRSRFGNEHNGSFEDEHQHYRHCRKHDSSFEDEDRRSRHQHKHHSSSDYKYHHRRKRSHSGREVELEEGEISSKSYQSKLSEGNGASREASVDISKPDAEGRAPSLPCETTTVSDDLRAKIRAMLLATL